MSSEPQIAFLGVCERAEYNDQEMKWNIIGLKQHVLSYIYPISIAKVSIGLSIRNVFEISEIKIRLKEEASGKEVFFINISLKKEPRTEITVDVESKKFPLIPVGSAGWMNFFTPLNLMIQNPGKHFVIVDDEIVGELFFHVVNPPPLTIERLAAIKSDPHASKAVRMDLGCKECPSKLKIYIATEPSKKLEEEGCIHRDNAPDKFICECGITTINTTLIKQNIHGFLGNTGGEIGQISLTKMYEKSALEKTRSDFARLLLEKNLKEEKIQKFLENNPILLHQFSAGIAGGIIFKPKFSNKFIGDFAITTSHDELVLIELEPLINLMTKNGRASAHLTHAFGQVNDWLQRVEDHKITTLTDLGINPDQIGKIRGVVIAGRSLGYDKKKLTALKRNDTGRISLLTYDDILSSMDTLISSMERL